MIFSSLDLHKDLQKGIDACGYSEMTPIQEQAIIPARRGKDLLATAQTGTGKTAAFAIPVLQQMIDKPRNDDKTTPRALILTPTRELAEQLASTIGEYAQFLPFKVASVYGGVKLVGQANMLKEGVDILIATPGRLLEHLEQCNVELSDVDYVVLDEADRMLDMGFVNDVVTILKLTNQKRQTLLFSATLSAAINELSHKILTGHQTIRASKGNETADTVDHVLYAVEERRKIELFLELLEEYNWYQVLVFTSTKEQADQLRLKLKRHPVAVCHGDKSQGSRRRAIADFKSAKVQILIATEVAARGLDIEGLEYVVNFNLPYLAEDYVHRIGRAGRAGQKGHAISFVSREEERSLANIQRMIGQKIKRINRPGYQVNYREELVKKVSDQKRPLRLNKSTKTVIKKTPDGDLKKGKPGTNKTIRKKKPS
ncbi:DEAD/DEAH box helicase [Leucothrix arctica]|uniref:RNA helicase n=1 Tax=Leucothrix arctica TaxID=1481894 RepID=A0A317CGA2_9GAMM|nr:DEAD/DEAH box helicase [Leucothrix arctica]PWQ95330.1 RNA helicase [Leucothrix arctica]